MGATSATELGRVFPVTSGAGQRGRQVKKAKDTPRFPCPGCGLSWPLNLRQPSGLCLDCAKEGPPGTCRTDYEKLGTAPWERRLDSQRAHGPTTEPAPRTVPFPPKLPPEHKAPLPIIDLPQSTPISREERKAWRKRKDVEPVIRQSRKALPMFAGKSDDPDHLDASAAIARLDAHEALADVRLPSDTMGTARRTPGDAILEIGETPKDLYLSGRPVSEDNDEDVEEVVLEAADLMVDEEIPYNRDGQDAPANWELQSGLRPYDELANTDLCGKCGERPAKAAGLCGRCYMRRRRSIV